MKTKNEYIESILNEAIDFFNIDEASLNKCNLLKLDYGYRVRYERGESGDIEKKIMDRGFIGLLKSKIGIESDSDSVVKCFIYGKRTVGLYIEAGIVYANQKLKESSDFLCLCYNVIKKEGFEFGGWVDLPTGEVKHKNNIKTLGDYIENAKTLETLDSDLGF